MMNLLQRITCQFWLALVAGLFASFGVVSAGVAGLPTSTAMAPLAVDTLAIKANQLSLINTPTYRFALELSETVGMTIKTDEGGLLATHPQRYQMGDWRATKDGIVIAALALNTSSIDTFLFNPDTHQLQQLTSWPASAADQEALCLYQHGEQLDMFVAEAGGQMKHIALMAPALQTPVQVRQFSTGPGIKACAVDDSQHTLYLADENAGIWQLSALAEAEEKRTLVWHEPGASIESVAVQPGAFITADTTSNRLWYVNSQQAREFTLPPGIQVEGLSTYQHGNRLYVNLYDDASATIKQIALPSELSQTSMPASPAVVPPLPDILITADAETAPVARVGDAADDPAIWINPLNPAQSRILGTDKKQGLDVFSLSGQRLQHLPVGRVNNVDIIYNVNVAGKQVDIAAASNRSDNSIQLFTITPQGRVSAAGRIATSLSDVYGLCAGRPGAQAQIIVNSTDGRFERFALDVSGSSLNGIHLESFSLPSQPEGCVIDDEREILFYGEEQAGVWRRNLNGPAKPSLIAQVNQQVHADIEGMALFDHAGSGQRYLIVSSQGNHRYAIYQSRAPYTLLGTFAITADLTKGIDGVSETDGLAATSAPLGKHYPAGLLVVQDGHNVLPSANQNFKLISGVRLNAVIEQLLAEH